MKVIQFLGYRNAGKTRAISYVARALTRRGVRVGTLKHIHDPSITVDAEGKDTWVHAKSGAKLVVAVSQGEVATISKRRTDRIKTDELLRVFRDGGIDCVLVEGYSGRFARSRGIVRVVCARSRRDASDLVKRHGRPACIVGKLDDAPSAESLDGTPVLRLPRDLPRLLRAIE